MLKQITEIHLVEAMRNGEKLYHEICFDFDSARERMDYMEMAGHDIRHEIFYPIETALPLLMPTEQTAIDEPIGLFTAVVSAGVAIVGIVATSLLM